MHFDDANSVPTETGADEDLGAVSTTVETSATVDELEGQLGKLQEAMEQIQRGDLDGAEASIVALENSRRAGGEEE